MSEDEVAARRSEAERWLAVAAEDRRVAHACTGIDPPAFGVAAYLCQQAAEKILKGLLILAGVEFALTHDLERLRRSRSRITPMHRDYSRQFAH